VGFVFERAPSRGEQMPAWRARVDVSEFPDLWSSLRKMTVDFP
jgi:hypothetical protein